MIEGEDGAATSSRTTTPCQPDASFEPKIVASHNDQLGT
jgi:hypothetical protein